MGQIELTNGGFALVDDADLEELSKYRWHRNAAGYAIRSNYQNKQAGSMLMHRQIMNAPKGSIVDHKNRRKLDNRRSNLRFATNSENMLNRDPWWTCAVDPYTHRWSLRKGNVTMRQFDSYGEAFAAWRVKFDQSREPQLTP